MRYDAVEVKGRRLIAIRHPELGSLLLARSCSRLPLAFHSSSTRPDLVLILGPLSASS